MGEKQTKVYVECTGRRISPFDDPIVETPIQNRTLKQWQQAAFDDGGFVRIDTPNPPCLIVPDTLLATGDGLRRFVDGARGKNAVLMLKNSLFAKATAPLQADLEQTSEGFLFKSVRFDAGTDAPTIPVVVDPMEKLISFPVPRQYFDKDEIEMSFPRDPIMTLNHWVHILWANQYTGTIELLRASKLRSALWILWGVLRAQSLNKWKVLGKFNRIGKKCDIHPTAIVEGSTLGDGVQVGPYARVLFSTVGENSVIMAGAQVEISQLGERSMVSQQTVLRFSVLYPEASAGQYLMQRCVLGRQSITTGGAFTQDINFKNPIRVMLDGQLISTEQQFLGCAFGHRTKIGTGFWMASGREVPNDTMLIRDPAQVLSKIPQSAIDSPLVVRGNRAEPR